MTSKQVLLTTTVALFISGCAWLPEPGAEPLSSPYASRRVWAVAPLRNESGSHHADGLILADHLARQLETAANLDVLPVNRVLAAMQGMHMAEVASPFQAQSLLGTLGADALVAGTITAYDPYDPPKLGLVIELYTDPRVEHLDVNQIRRLSHAATDLQATLSTSVQTDQPVCTVSAVLNASDPLVREELAVYASDRGQRYRPASWHLYRISMDLYSEFVSYVMSWRLLRAEARRITPTTTPPAP